MNLSRLFKASLAKVCTAELKNVYLCSYGCKLTHMYMRAYMHTESYSFIHSFTDSYGHADIHTYIHYIHMYMHTGLVNATCLNLFVLARYVCTYDLSQSLSLSLAQRASVCMISSKSAPPWSNPCTRQMMTLCGLASFGLDVQQLLRFCFPLQQSPRASEVNPGKNGLRETYVNGSSGDDSSSFTAVQDGT